MLASPLAERLAQKAKFVFKGVVRKVKASTMAELSADDATAVVNVQQILHAPPFLARFQGKDITVRIPAAKKLEPNQEAVFFANGLRVGDSVAVQAID